MPARRFSLLLVLCLALPFAVAACDSEGHPADEELVPPDDLPPEAGDELPIGAIDDLKEDGDWTHAVRCKTLPVVEPLADPAITVSLDGLTIHLVDRAGTYDRVFPIGPGQIQNGKSLTPVSTTLPEGLFWTRTDQPAVQDGPTPATQKWGWNESCNIWWKSETGQQLPVFAGLPFIRLQGPPTAGYGIHGPIDNYTMPNGGTLRRGYVSHGCIRMDAADLGELYGRILGKRVPVRVQKAVERRADGTAVDVRNKWFLAECQTDADCNYEGGLCRVNPYSGRGFCTQQCSLYCPDRAGNPSTYCVADPADATKGVCTFRPDPVQNGCKRWGGFLEKASVPRSGQPSTKKSACVPGSGGWIGDACVVDADCTLTDTCLPVEDGVAGVCTEPCARYCPDATGRAATFCVGAPPAAGTSGGVCLARCSNNDDCPPGATCESEPRYSDPATVRSVCLPY